jgi:hypothetical protein
MSVAPQVLSTTYHYAKCILTVCIIKMGVKKILDVNHMQTAL